MTALVVRVRVPAGRAELAGDELWALGAGAVTVDEPDATTVVLTAGYPTPDAARAAVADLAARYRAELVEVDERDVDAWRDHAEAVDVGSLVVVPAWRDVALPPGPATVAIDPQRCFGSGSHPSTRLLLIEIDRRLPPGGTVLDVGTGSGILAVAAAMCGASTVEAIDIDPAAVDVVVANATRNGVGGRVTASATPLGSVTATFDLVVANLTAATLVALAPDLTRVLGGRGWLLLSGMLHGQWRHVAPAFTGLDVVDVRELDGWTAAVLRAPPPA